MISVGLGILTGQVASPSASVSDEYRTLCDLAETAEDSGFDSVWVSEHHFSPDGYLPSVFPVLGAVAAVTSHVGLGTAAVIAPFHHPLRLAEDAAVTDLLSGGRLTLGLVSGWRDAEFRGFSVPRSKRARRLEETVAILRQAWRQEVWHQGREYVIEGVDVRPRPPQPIPILLGGFAAPAVDRAGRIADGFIASADSVDAVSLRFKHAMAAASDAGREPFRLAVMLDAAFTGTPGALDGYRYKQEVYRHWKSDAGTSPATSQAPGQPDSLLVHGDAAALIAGIARYVPSSCDDITLIVRLHFPGMRLSDSIASVRRFGAEVIPSLREGSLD